MQRIMSISNSFGILLDLGELSFPGDFSRMNGDRARRADELAELAGDAPLAAVVIGHERRRAAIMLGHLRVPFLLGILHEHLGLALEHSLEMLKGNRETRDNRRQINFLRKGEFGTWDDVSHDRS